MIPIIQLHSATSRIAALAMLIPITIGCSGSQESENRSISVAISTDIPPYVLNNATSGIEVDIAKRALPDFDLKFTQMPYEELQHAVEKGQADVAIGVQEFKKDGASYSDDFITFENVAVTKKSAEMTIDSVADLKGHKIVTWQDAYRELGPEFENLFSSALLRAPFRGLLVGTPAQHFRPSFSLFRQP